MPEGELTRNASGETSAEIRARVESSFQFAVQRQGKANAALTTKEIDKFCAPDNAGEALLKQAISRLNLSARGYHRILRVARTIADLEGAAEIKPPHVVEAIGYRSLDRKLWAR